MSTRTHPSGIVETYNYNSNGYFASVSAGGSTKWTVTNMNARQQVTGGTYGSALSAAFGFDSHGYPTSTVTGTTQQHYQYQFNPETGNLNWRKNVLHDSIQENFAYDNLDRLDSIYMGSSTTLDLSYGNNGNISEKSDAGTLLYGTSFQPYSVTGIDPSTGLVPSAAQFISYNSFEKVDTISENGYQAIFTYNADGERSMMVVKQNGIQILKRIYAGSRYIKETVGTITKEYVWIGGDSYSAPAIATNFKTGYIYYYVLRDYLGSITHILNPSGSVKYEYSYDAWGRMRDEITWQPYSPGSEPTLFANCGFTGHEHLPWFNLINMNGRLYDPLVGRFLSPDNVVSQVDFSQSYNRYSYALNNPLKYTDKSGNAYMSPLFLDAIYPRNHKPHYSRHTDGSGGYEYNWWTGYYNDRNGNIVSPYNVNNYILGNSGGNNVVQNGKSNSDAIFELASSGGLQILIDGLKMIYSASNTYYTQSVFELDQIWLGTATDFRTNISGYYLVVGLEGECGFWSNNAQGGGDATGIPQSDAFKYGVAGTSIWGSTVKGGFDAARTIQPKVSTWAKGARVMGRTNTVLTAATVGYDFATGTANTSTLVNAGVNVTGAIVVGIVGVTAAPWVAGGLVVYGIVSIAGGDEWLNSHFDISNKINFVTPAATTVYRGPNGGYVVEGTW